jgi:hypothetical protein
MLQSRCTAMILTVYKKNYGESFNEFIVKKKKKKI